MRLPHTRRASTNELFRPLTGEENTLPAPEETRQAFESYLNSIIHQWSGIMAALGLLLIPLFAVLDYFTMPTELLTQFLWLRGITTLLVLVQFVFIRRTTPGRYPSVHGYAFSLVVGGMIVLMTRDLGGFDSSYYAGLNLVIVAVNLFLPWSGFHSAINGILIILMYVGVNGAAGSDYEPANLINNLYFLGATVIISVAINQSKHKLIEKEFNQRAELGVANRRLDATGKMLKRARDALWGEMEVAKHIQTVLLPAGRRLGRYHVTAVMQPANEVGGDYYDIIDVPRADGSSHRQWLAIGDVSGHGVESGLVMMMTQTSVLALITNNPDAMPSSIYAGVNAAMAQNVSRLGTHRYMTLNIIRLEEDGMWVAGKHQDIMVWRAEQNAVEVIPTDGCWIGVVPDCAPFSKDTFIPLGPTDVVLLYTDGVTEAVSGSGELFGRQRLMRVLSTLNGALTEDALKGVLAELIAFQPHQDDDITMMILQVASPEADAGDTPARAWRSSWLDGTWP